MGRTGILRGIRGAAVVLRAAAWGCGAAPLCAGCARRGSRSAGGRFFPCGGLGLRRGFASGGLATRGFSRAAVFCGRGLVAGARGLWRGFASGGLATRSFSRAAVFCGRGLVAGTRGLREARLRFGRACYAGLFPRGSAVRGLREARLRFGRACYAGLFPRGGFLRARHSGRGCGFTRGLSGLLLISAAVFSGCSLKYGSAVQDNDRVPEFIFSDVSFDRYEDSQLTSTMTAARLEQYKDGKSMYARDIQFELFTGDGEVDTSGACDLLAADTGAEKYTLYGNIKIRNEKNDTDVSADSLKWNGKSEQLTSGRNDMVIIKKGGATIFGSGFSASGVSKKFAFTGVVTGEIETDSENGAETGGGADSPSDSENAESGGQNPRPSAAAASSGGPETELYAAE